MAFQFSCPQGHVLQTDESFAGQTIQCPQCGTTFVIPPPTAQPPPAALATPPAPPPAPPMHGGEDSGEGSLDVRSRKNVRFSFIDEGDDSAAGAVDDLARIQQIDQGPLNAFDPTGGKSVRMVTIPCPNGHPIQCAYSDMSEEILCPRCGEQFVLRYTDSLEYQRDKEMKEQAAARKLGKTWFTWAIVAACGVVVMIIALIVMASTR